MKSIPARRVLLAADLSPATPRAAAWGRRLAARGAVLEAFYAAEPPPPELMGLPAAAAATPPERRAVAARLELAAPGFKASVESGSAAPLILRRARSAGLVVMGTHGRAGIDRALLGSVAETVLRASPRPVLVTRTAPPAKVRTVLAPVNLEPYALKGLLLAAETAAHLGARLVLLHVTADRGSNPSLFLGGMVERLPRPIRDLAGGTILVRHGDPVREILAEASRHQLVVLTAHLKSLLRDLVLGTTAERVLRHSPVPVLTAPSK